MTTQSNVPAPAAAPRWTMLVSLVLTCACTSQGALVTEADRPEPAAHASPSPGVNSPKPTRENPDPLIAMPAAEPSAEPSGDPGFEPISINDSQLERARRLQPLVLEAAAEHDLDPNLINGIIWVESKFNAKARNKHSGAQGLMQLMPGTSRAMAKRLGERSRPYEADYAVRAGTLLLSIMARRFDDDETLILFAYARGGGSVRKWQTTSDPLPDGVRKFIARVERARRTFESLGFPHPD